MSCIKDNYCLIKQIKVIPIITNIDQKSKAFITWSKGITFKDNFIILPDGTKIDGKIFMDNQQRFDNGQYTKLILDYFNGR